MYKDTVTVFNRKNGEDITWYARVLHNVDFNADVALIRQMYGESAPDRAKLHIMYRSDKVGNYTYLLPKEFQSQADVSDKITFQTGEDFDFFWLGVWNGTTISDGDYQRGFFDYMVKTYDNVFAVSSVAKYSVIPHFEVMGR